MSVQPSQTTIAADGQVRRIAGIPVRNLWLLMFYASDLFRDHGTSNRDVEENPDDLPNLVAEILCRRVEIRLHRRLGYGFQRRDAILTRVRGRIDVFDTERKRLLEKGKIACKFDELSINTPRNCYVREALDTLSRIVSDPDLAHQCRTLARSMRSLGVSGDAPARGSVSIHRFGRHDAIDAPMVSAAHLAFNLALPTQEAGGRRLSDPETDIHWIRRLYERGVGGFYDVVTTPDGWTVVQGKPWQWPVSGGSPGLASILPLMRTDIVLEHKGNGRRVVLDTKFNDILKPGQYGGEKLRSGYLYQIYAYLRTQESDLDPFSANAMGILLHPAVGVSMSESATIQGHELRFATVDLSASAATIRAQLLEVLEVPHVHR